MPGDGHCFISSILKSLSSQWPNTFSFSKDELLSKIERETLDNMNDYAAFLNDENTKSHLVRSMYQYILDKKYDTSYGDLIPLITANAVGIDIGIVIKTSDQFDYRHIVSKGSTDDCVFIVKNGMHYDSLILTSEFTNQNGH